MSSALQAIETKYGKDVASDVERLLGTAMRESLMSYLGEVQRSISALLGSFRTGEMLPAGDLQKVSYRLIEERLKDRGKLLLLYKSVPSAAMFDLKQLDEIQEELEAMVATLVRSLSGLGEATPEEFWTAMDQARPGNP
ncbi:MAG: hypothetical protein HYY08_03445 [Firmicutes bacterium]|nr:hypothetical protein [Bacillota bacterium]